MQDILQANENLKAQVQLALERLAIASQNTQLQALQSQVEAPEFWQDAKQAQDVSKQVARLRERVQPWLELQKSIQEIDELAALNDESLKSDLQQQLSQAEQKFGALKEQLKFAGPFDAGDAILSIHAGAGGTDAQDWAAMLQRMYLRWSEQHQYSVTMVDESAGEEAGIKSTTFEISGTFVLGKLKGEHGVHRLVRLSPFNADALRQTSFAKVEILPKVDQPDAVVIDEKDLKIDVYRSGGHGGQSVNTTDSAVRITHLPTNIVVAIQNERSQLQNKETAMTILRSKLAQLQLEQHAENLRELKGPNEQAAWGNQIRSYVLHPYKQVKDLRTRYETSDPEAVLDGGLDPFIDAYLEYSLGDDSKPKE
jgi:peptide chain release factor 2